LLAPSGRLISITSTPATSLGMPVSINPIPNAWTPPQVYISWPVISMPATSHQFLDTLHARPQPPAASLAKSARRSSRTRRLASVETTAPARPVATVLVLRARPNPQPRIPDAHPPQRCQTSPSRSRISHVRLIVGTHRQSCGSRRSGVGRAGRPMRRAAGF
jgi:hypothetical protein